MNIKIVYHSQTGNTKIIAQAIAEELGVPAEEITSKPQFRGIDLLFVGGCIHAFNLERTCKSFLKSLEGPSQVKNVAVFATSASGKGIYKFASKLLPKKGINLLPDECHCRGGENKKTGQKNPDKKDIAAAKEFAKKTVAALSE
jgi:flavodoxin